MHGGWVIDVFYPNNLGAELRSRESRGDGSPEWVVIPTVKGGVLGSGIVADFVSQKRYGKKLMGYPAEGPEEIRVQGLEGAAAICETIRDIGTIEKVCKKFDKAFRDSNH